MNRDPLGERGFETIRSVNWPLIRMQQPNLYTFVDNDPNEFFDSLGLDPNSPECQELLTQYNFHMAIHIAKAKHIFVEVVTTSGTSWTRQQRSWA